MGVAEEGRGNSWEAESRMGSIEDFKVPSTTVTGRGVWGRKLGGSI